MSEPTIGVDKVRKLLYILSEADSIDKIRHIAGSSMGVWEITVTPRPGDAPVRYSFALEPGIVVASDA